METPFPGIGTGINVIAVVLGAVLGMAFGHRLREETRSLVTDCLGLVTLLVALLSAMAVNAPAFVELVGSGAPVLLVLGALVIGVLVGSVISEGYVHALTAVGRLILMGLALRLLKIKDLPVGNLLPALAVIPVLVWVVSTLR